VILSVTLNPSVDHALFLDELKVGDTNRVKRTERDAGGKGVNLSRVVAELGGKTLATGFIGGGPGDYVKGVLDRQGVSHLFIEVNDDTRINFSVEDASERPPTTFNEQGPQIRPEDIAALRQRVTHMLAAGGIHWMTLGGSLPPGVPSNVFRDLISLAHQYGVRVALDADGEPLKLGLQARPEFVKPNAKECERLLGCEIEGFESAIPATKQIRSLLGQDAVVVVSLGESGAVLAGPDGLMRGYTPEVEARSTIGSGDSLVAGMLWAMMEGKCVDEAFRWGMACGAATASTNGSEIARRAKILELLPFSRIERIADA
jgi:1-phosphofructokinase